MPFGAVGPVCIHVQIRPGPPDPGGASSGVARTLSMIAPLDVEQQAESCGERVSSHVLRD